MSLFTAFFSGLLFAAGLAVSGMVMPSKVMGFLDFAGDWDPSLAFVMGSALVVYAPLFRVIVKRKWPFAASAFELPSATHLDGRLISGAALFGVGWGLGGMCPGPAIVATGAALPGAFVFVLSMISGATLFRLIDTWNKERKERSLALTQPDA